MMHGTESTLAAPQRLGPAENRLVRAGFIPLIDIAVLIAAQEMGFASREGIALDLIRDVSWSNIRDRLAFRQFDVAHALSPMPVASMLGLGSNPYPSFAPFALGRGGNAITLSVRLYREMQEVAGLRGDESALINAQALKQVINRRRAQGAPPLVFAMTYPFSSHNYEFRYWMAAGGVHPDRDVVMTVVPPPLTADALAAGAIDGFCVNAPWNVIAVQAGAGRIVATKADIWPSAPEKVLSVRPEWADANPDTLARLLVALEAAAKWCDASTNRADLANMLAQPRYIGADAAELARLLSGRISIDPDGRERLIEDYFVFHDNAATFPAPAQALWIYSQMVRWGQIAHSEANMHRVHAAYRPDIYCAATGRMPDLSRSESFIDGRNFDPESINTYIASFDIQTAPGQAASPDYS